MIRKTDLWKLLTYLVIFLIPTQLAIHFWPDFSFVYGIRVDYLSPAIYLTDILIFLLVTIKALDFVKIIRKNKKVVYLLLLLIVFNVGLSSNPAISTIRWIKVLVFLLFFVLVYIRKKELSLNKVFNTILYSASFFSLIGIYQFFFGKTTGLFWLLGERSFTLNSPGIALVELSGQDFLRAYSTFSHPNSMGGYLGLVILFIIFQHKYIKSIFDKFLFAVIFLGFVLTFSFSSMVALLISLVVSLVAKKFPKKMTYTPLLCFAILSSFALPLVSTKIFAFSKGLGAVFSERVELSYFAGQMINNNFFIGVGLNTFIPNIPKLVGILNYSWILQPVHNIFLLVFSELGILGFVVFFVAIYKLLKNGNIYLKMIVVFVITSGLFDHYWVTLQQNNLLLVFLIGLFI